MEYLDNDIKYVGGVGEARARLLDKELGIRTLGDMLSHYPFRYIDRTKVYRIAEITEGAPTLLQFRARITGVAYAGTGRKKRFTAYVQDPTGSAELVWFQGIKWIEKRVEVGREYLIFGRPSFYRGLLSMAHPELETMEQALSRKAESGMQGIYPSTEKLSNVLGAKGMYQIICNTWALVKDHITDCMPEAVRARYGLIPLRDAYYNIHFPQSAELLRQAQYRLKFDELLGIQLNVQSRRTERLSKNNGFLFMKVGLLHRYFVATRLEQTAQRGRGDTLAQGRNHATGYEHMLGHIELPALPVEVVYPHLTGLHCNTRAADRSQFFSRAIAFLNLETKRRPVSQAASLWQGLHAAIDQQPRPQAFLERACRYGRPQDTTRHVR